MGVLGQAGRMGLIAAACVCLSPASSAIGGVRKATVDYRAMPVAAETNFFNEGGLSMSGECAAGSELKITLRSDVADAFLSTSAIDNIGFSHSAVTDFGPGLTASPLADGQSDQGQIIYSTPAGNTVTIDWAADEDPALADGLCLFFGSAQVAAPGRPRSQARQRVDFRADVGAGQRPVLDAGGLRLRASCRGSEGAAALRVVAPSSADHAVLHAGGLGEDGARYYAGDDNLRAKRGRKRPERFKFLAKLGATDFGLGRLVYVTPRRKVVAVRWLAEENDAYAGRRDCVFVGSASIVQRSKQASAYFARRRAKSVPSRAARGIFGPFVPTTRFFSLGGVELSGACAKTEEPNNLFVRHTVDLARQEGSPYFTPVGPRAGGGGGSAGGGGSVTAPDHSVGVFLLTQSNGNTVAVDYLAEERNAFGGRKRCLFAGAGELTRTP